MRYATPYTLIASIGLFAAIPLVLLSYIVYALYLHSLAKYPGPLLGRLTQCYDVYHAYKGDKHVLFHRLHQQYGPIVRFSPNTVSINHPAALKAIYAHGANVQKSTFYKCFRAAPQAVSTLLATDKAQHARKRRVMSQAFSAEAMRGMEVYVVGLVQDLVDKIDGVIKASDAEEGGWSGTGPMASYLNWLVFDIMGDLVFGKSFGTLGDKPENREGIRLLGRAAKRNYVVGAMPILAQRGLEKWLPFLRSRYLDRCKCLAFGKAQVLARTKENGFGESGRRDIFSYLLHAKVSLMSRMKTYKALTLLRTQRPAPASRCPSYGWKATRSSSPAATPQAPPCPLSSSTSYTTRKCSAVSRQKCAAPSTNPPISAWACRCNAVPGYARVSTNQCACPPPSPVYFRAK